MNISVLRHNSKSRATSPWLVVVPRRLSETGKRQFRYFHTKAEAKCFAASIRGLVRKAGERPAVLSEGESADARAAQAILKGSGISLVQAAWLVRKLLSSGLPLAMLGAEEQAPPEQAEQPEPPQPRRVRSPRIPTFQQVLRDMQAGKTHQSPYTQRSRNDRFRTFLRRNADIARTPIKLLTAARIKRALDATWPHAPTGWNCMLTHLMTLFNYAVRKGILTSNPLTCIDRKHVTEKEIRPVAPSTLRSLLEACRPPNEQELSLGADVPRAHRQELAMDTSELAAYIAIAAFAGIRPVEITRLRWGDINLEDACISVRRAASKTGGTRHVEIHPTLLAWLAPLQPQLRPQGEVIFPAGAGLARKLRAVRRRAGFHAGNPWPEDALRHSYASYFLKAGGDINKLQLYMGHASGKLIYARYCNMCGLTRQMAAEWWSMSPAALRGRKD